MKFTGVALMAAVLALATGHPQRMFSGFVRRTLESEETGNFDIATIHAVDSYSQNRLSKEDLQSHADDLSTDHRKYSLQFSSGQELRMSVTRQSIDTSGASFTELTEEGQTESIDVDLSTCFFSGTLDNAEGFASLSLCEGEVLGSISTPDRDYQIHTLPNQGDLTGYPDDVMVVSVKWEYKDKASDNVNDDLDIPDDKEPVPFVAKSAKRRSVADRRATIEICDLVDKFYVADMAKNLHITRNSQIIQLLITKWTGVARMLSNVSQVGWDIGLRLVRVAIMRKDPSWYYAPPNVRLGARMIEVCFNTANLKNFAVCDHIAVHTGGVKQRERAYGLSWTGGLCNVTRRCSALRMASTAFSTELHELGHNMGLRHDIDEYLCRKGSDQKYGFMGGNPFHFRKCYKEILAHSLAQKEKSCIFTNAVDTKDIIADFHDNSE